MLALAAAALLGPAIGWAIGELTQKAGSAGCVSSDGSAGACRQGRALEGASGAATSSDGRNVYIASAFASGGVAVFDRGTDGALTQKAGTAGCISQDGNGGACVDGEGLEGARGVTVSADGRNVYVASETSDAVAVFDRNPGTGALSQRAGSAACVSNGGGACLLGKALEGARGVAVSPDGTSVYVSARNSNAVAILDRDVATGALTPKAASAGCISTTDAFCRPGRALGSAWDVAISADGQVVYVASAGANAIAVFDRDPGGGLTQRAGAAGCVSDGGSGGECQSGKALRSPRGLAISHDGARLYVAAHGSDAVAIFDRDPGGGLTQKAGTAGCVSETGSGGACQDGSALLGAAGLALSPDGSSVYAGAETSDAVAIFDRDPAGGLTQKAGTAGCVSETGTGGACQDGTALDSVKGLSVSPDGGRSVYVAALVSGAVAILDRPPPPAPASPAAPALRPGACANRRTGTSRSERLTGTPAGDRISGLAGEDRISGLAGKDCLSGGSGNDRVSGGSGNDRVSGGSGNDRVSGGSGNDVLSGGKGRDRISGGAGNDRLSSADGVRDVVDCGSGRRDLVVADRKDRLRGCERRRRR